MTDNQYKIELGVDLNESQLNTVKKILQSIEDQKRDVIYNVDFNIKNLDKLTKVGSEIEKIQDQLNSIGSSKKVNTAIPIDSKQIETTLANIHNTIKKLQNAFGRVDKNKGVQSLLTTVNKISKSLETVSKQFEGLNKNLSSLTSKDFSLNFDFGIGKSNSKSPEQIISEIKMLKKEAEEYEKYLAKLYKVENQSSTNPVQKMIVQHAPKSQMYFHQLQNAMLTGAPSQQQIAAYKEYLSLIKQTAAAANISLAPVEFRLAESGDFVKVRNEVNETEKQLKELFSGGIDAENLHRTLDGISADLHEISETLKGLSSGVSVEGLTQSFDKLSETIGELVSNVTLVKNALGNGLDNVVSSDEASKQAQQAQQAQESANAVVQAEERKRQAIRETQGVVSGATQQSIDNVSSKSIFKAFKVSDSDSAKFKQEMENLVSQWTNAKGKLTDIKINTETFYDADMERNIERISRAQVTYNNELGETIKKVIAIRQIGTGSSVVDGKETVTPKYGFSEVSAQYSKSLGKSKVQLDAFVKQQKQAVSNLTNQINQLNRAASDQNAPRAIKDSSHLNALTSKYNDVISAIQRMGTASSDTFVDEQNNVKKLISEFKSLVSEYKNAENVSTKMKGTNFESGLNIAKNDLEKFKADAKDFPQIKKTINELDKAISGVGDASSLNEFNDQLRVARSELAKIKSETSAANRSEKAGINVSGLQSKIANLQRLSPEIDEFEAEINGSKVTVQSLLDDLNKVNTQSDFSVVNSKWRAFTEAAQKAGIAVAETSEKVNALNRIYKKLKPADGSTDFDREIVGAETDFAKLSNQSNELRVKIQALKNEFNAIKAANADGDVDELYEANKRYEQILQDVNNQLKINRDEEARSRRDKQNADNADNFDLDKIKAQQRLRSPFDDNSAAAKKFGSELNRLEKELNDCGDPSGLKKINKEIDIFKNKVNAASVSTESFGSRFKKQWQQYSSYFSVASLFMYAEQGLRSMFEQAKLIDSAMTELKKVTDETDASYNQFLTNAASRSKELGTTIDGLVSSTADFARLGYGFEDAQGLAEVANVYAVVGDEIEGVEGATESLISTMAAFKDEMSGMSDADFAMSIIDVYNEIGNNFAISSGGLGEALERSASSLAAANNTLHESAAMITAANEVVQNPEKIGNAMKTISMRMKIHCPQ